MSLSLLSSPSRWTSAYRPMEFSFRSSLFDLTDIGDSIPIIDITQQGTETVLRLTNNFGTGDINVGEPIRIAGTVSGVYDGTWRVLRIVSTAFDVQVAINAPYSADDTGGTAFRVYDNFRIGCEVVFSRDETVAVPFTLDADADGIFTLNIQDAAARQFASPFTEALIGAPNIYLPANTSVAMGYNVTAFERYTKWTDGVPSTVELRKPFQLDIRGFRVVNMVHPYHQELDGGGVAMDWQSSLDDYLFSQNASGKKFLTWASRTTQTVNSGDNFYLAILCDFGAFTAGTDFVVSTYTADNVFIAATPFELDAAPEFAAFINVGPAALGSVITSQTAYYRVGIRNRNDGLISETFTLNYSRSCGEVARRFYWQNKLGGIDQYTLKGRERERTVTEREVVQSNYIPLASTRGFNARMYRTTPLRLFTISSDFMKPEELRWLTRDLFESSDVAAYVNTRARTPHTWWTPIVMQSDEATGFATDSQLRRLIFDFSYGVDNRSQFG